MNEKFRHVVIILFVELLAVFVLWFSWHQAHVKVMPPKFIRDALPFSTTEHTTNTITMQQITPFPNEDNITTYPTIIATALIPFSQNTTVELKPSVPTTTVFSSGNQTITVTLQKPLIPNKTYQVTINDNGRNGQYTWSFKTGQATVDPKLVPAIDRVKQQMPYTDPNGQFSIYYAAQTDRYFITIHNNAQSVSDQQAALAWLRSQGVTDTSSLQITWVPSDAF